MIMDITPVASPGPATKQRTRRSWAATSTLLVGILLVGAPSWYFLKTPPSPVPSDIRRNAGFRVYYPEQGRLPSGYSLDMASFRLAQPGVVIFSLQVGTQRLIFSEEQTPDTSVMDKFTSSYIPLHTEIATALGKAEMGAAGQGAQLQTVVSLPISKGPWLIMTAPANTKQSDVQRILQSLVK